MALEMAIAGATCGPGITLTPTMAPAPPSCLARAASAVPAASGSTLPSISWYSWRPSRAAPSDSSDSGIRIDRREHIRGLISSTWGGALIARRPKP